MKKERKKNPHHLDKLISFVFGNRMKLVFAPIIIAGGDSFNEISPVGCLKIGLEKFTCFVLKDFLELFCEIK